MLHSYDTNRTMSKNVLIIMAIILLSSCESALVNPKLEVITLNKSDGTVSWVKIFIQDTELRASQLINVGNPVQVASFTNIGVGEQSSIATINLEQFSQTGNGNTYVLVVRENSSDTLRNGAGSYTNFRDSQEFAPTRWRTREIIINNPNDKKGEVYVNLAYYKDGKYVESYGR